MWLGWCGEGGREGGLSLYIKLTGESSVGRSNQSWRLHTRSLSTVKDFSQIIPRILHLNIIKIDLQNVVV